MMRVVPVVGSLGLLIGTALVPLPVRPETCLTIAQTFPSDTRYFGQNAQNGRDGRSGRKGRDGENRTVTADGSSVTLDLSGRDGENGDDGEDALSALCNRQPEDANNDLYAPNGGRGGNGGNGGDGGNGGSLTVYYTNPANLKNISVRSGGGEGGRSGRGGRGTPGCRCRQRNWTRQRCTGTPGSSDYRCTSTTYRCTDGSDGSNGSDGSDGRTGGLGQLTLIPQLQPLLPDAPTLTVPLSGLQAQPLKLSRNRWKSLRGAANLLAPGSIIADEYREFLDRIEGSVQLVWQEPLPRASFGDPAVTVALREDKQVAVSFPDDLWVNGSSSTEGTLTRYAVKNVVRQSDATRLAVAEFAGRDQSVSLALVDLARRSQVLQTEFWIRYRASNSRDRFDRFGDYETLYEGAVPANLVKQDYDRFTLALGQLPIDTQYLQSGVKVEIEVVATRSLGGRSAKQTITWQGEVRR